MATIKRIQLSERDIKTGKIVKNESFLYSELKNLIKTKNKDFFNHWLWGKVRLAAVDLVFLTLSALTDLDKPGRNRLHVR